MAKDTTIAWCDSTLNLMMGCDGCELWNPGAGKKICYAGNLTSSFAGRSGWPESFNRPVIFPERVDRARSWTDLTGLDRPAKPWLNGLPRLVFLNDMGDTFTKSLPIDWLAPLVDELARTPHIYILLTKRASKMSEFWKRHGPPPRNFWLLVSITSADTWVRAETLLGIDGAAVRGLSYEPANGALASWEELRRFDWVIFGGESIQDEALTTPCDLDWAIEAQHVCHQHGRAFFMKQLGSNASLNGRRIETKEPKGEDWNEFPSRLRMREMPRWAPNQGSLF